MSEESNVKDLEFRQLYNKISKNPILMRRVIGEFIKRGKVKLTRELCELTDSGVEKVFHHIHVSIGNKGECYSTLELSPEDIREVL